MRKPTTCICENKGADQLHSNCEADQRLCFLYTNSEACIGYFGIRDIGLFFFFFFFFFFLRDTGIFVFFLFLGYGIFRNFGIWDIGIYFGIRVKLILGYGLFWDNLLHATFSLSQ